MVTRFVNTGERLGTFADEFFVRCPRCQCQARVTNVSRPRQLLTGCIIAVHARTVCPHCAYAQEKAVPGYCYGTATDWYFGLPLWFQASCCGETLWAYNRRHIAYLERYVQADLRDECSYPKTGLARYLPHWMKSAKNRDEVLKCLDRLKRL